ncbi:MAG: hypothetical protein WC091_20310 [Sulfuricellaceae bacterium]
MDKRIEKTFSAKDFNAFSQGAVPGERPIAIVPDDIKSLLNVSSEVVLLSQHTSAKQYGKHPEITPTDYMRLQPRKLS